MYWRSYKSFTCFLAAFVLLSGFASSVTRRALCRSHVLQLSEERLGAAAAGQLAVVSSSLGAYSSSEVKAVKHAALLNKRSFWWLMGTLIFFIGVAVVKMERGAEEEPAAGRGQSKVPEGQQSATETDGSSPRLRSWMSSLGFTPIAIQRVLRVLYCVVALNFSMLLWGISQEFVMTNNYAAAPSLMEKMPSSLFVVLCNRLSTTCFSATIIHLHGQSLRVPGYTIGAKAAVSNGISSWCQYQSLKFISFTLQTTAKSAKMLPVLILSSCRGKKHGLLDYAETVVIVVSLVVFGVETDGREKSLDATSVGALLLGVLLVADSFTPHLQDMLFTRHPEVNAMQATMAMSSVAAGGIFVIELVTGSLFTCLSFLAGHPEALLHLAVLSVSSTLTQYFISYTVKHLGPTVFTLIASTRQVIAVCVSAVLFQHRISPLAAIAVVLVFSMVFSRALRGLLMPREARQSGGGGTPQQPSKGLAKFIPLLIATLVIHVLYCFYAVVQEFLSVHTFRGRRFSHPVFNVAINHACGALLGFVMVRRRGSQSACGGNARLTLLPAMTNFVATFCQHQALYSLSFPTQTLIKTFKLVPVMLVGKFLGTQKSTVLDYVDGALITGLVAFFVGQFFSAAEPMAGKDGGLLAAHSSGGSGQEIGGVLLMMGYLIADSFTCNLQDSIFQAVGMDPAQMLFGLEVASSVVAWTTLVVSGQFFTVIEFLHEEPRILLHLLIMSLTSACGAYACAITVRLFGPSVFTLLMVSRQVQSLIISVAVFNHPVSSPWMKCLSLVAVSLLVMTSAVRRVGVQLVANNGQQRSGAGAASGAKP